MKVKTIRNEETKLSLVPSTMLVCTESQDKLLIDFSKIARYKINICYDEISIHQPSTNVLFLKRNII